MEWIYSAISWIPDITEIVLLCAIIVQVNDNKELINKHNKGIK